MSRSWWRMSLQAHPLARLLQSWSGPLIWTGALANAGCAAMWAEREPNPPEVGLDVQQQDGWNVGSEGEPLVFVGGQATDISGGTGWRAGLTGLTARLSPADPRWQPYYAPALFQALDAPRSEDLRAALRPVYTAQMRVDYLRGEGLLSLLVQSGACRQDVALVLDLPGPEAVAVAAAVARCFDPVFVFDNWPHPRGVVPAHATLGAAIYFLPEFERTRAARSASSPPAFVLDRQRLVPYSDAAGQFDNRYFAGLPSWEGLHAAGIRHLLYVTLDAATMDADDLNGDLVALDQGGIDVKILALGDFSETPLPGWLDDPGAGCATPSLTGVAPQFYFGGSPAAHGCFGWWYGLTPSQSSGSVVNLPPVPQQLTPRCRFRPSLRPTMSAVGGFHHLGGGHLGGHSSRSFLGRSGSLGRAHGGFGG